MVPNRIPLTAACRRLSTALLIAFLSSFGIAFSQNPIVTENALPGNPKSEWDVAGAGDLTIQGFATQMSVNKGETIRFKIKTTAALYSIKIYRLGYYQGNGARLIINLGNFSSTSQPSPVTDASTGLIDCSNWSESASWNVPANAVSGVYIAKLIRSGDGGSSHIIFVVRDDAGNADLLFKTSDATWQAYNVYGGNSLYVGAAPFPGGRAAKVSYNRPFVTRSGGGGGGEMEDWIFNAEHPMIRFLERNGFNVSYTTDVDMDKDPAPITPAKHKVLLSVGHDEYWSLNERTKFENARNAGVHLAFFSGNEVYWKTRWEDNHRTLVCYKEGTLGENTCGDCDPDQAWTGLWRDGCSSSGSGGCKPENALSGQISWYETHSTLTVPSAYKDLRFWRNTSVASLNAGETATLTPGTLGYEWDFEQYPASYPAGRITMSNTTIAGKTHKLSLYRHASGALVFGAGTVQWSWGLDEVHDRGNDPADPAMQQATINLFADMGVQPATLMPGLVQGVMSTDSAAPSSIITAPAHNSTLQANVPVLITGTSADGGGGVLAGIEVSTDGGTTWQIATGTTNWTLNWTPLFTGTYTIKVRGFDDSGNIEVPGSNGSANHITVVAGGSNPVCPCTIFSPSSAPGSTVSNDGVSIEVGLKFRATHNGYIKGIRFYKATGNSGVHVGHLWSNTGVQLAEATFTNESVSGWQQVLFNTPVPITANTTYVASYFSSAGYYSSTANYFTSPVINGYLRGLADGEDGPNGVYLYTSQSAFPYNSYQSSSYWVDVVFETENATDTARPVITSVIPAAGATNVNVSTAVVVNFNEPINPSTAVGNFELRSGNTVVSAGITTASGQVTLTPSAPLNNGTVYTATIKGGAQGVKDMAGNALASDYSWSFTTSATSTPSIYTIFTPSHTPAIEAENDGTPIEVGVKFRASQSGFITGIRFYKGVTNTGTHVGNLWNGDGKLLATATFVNETSSGWQQVLFETPVPIAANTTYIASYFSPNGYYAVTTGYFTNAVVNGPLKALANGEDGENGIYKYTPASAFPTLSYQASNYWVDVVFSTGGTRPQGALDPEQLYITVRPNPSSSYFQLIYLGTDSAISVRVMDISGKVVENYQNLPPDNLLRIGEKLRAGIYFAEVMQGNKRKVLKLVKTN